MDDRDRSHLPVCCISHTSGDKRGYSWCGLNNRPMFYGIDHFVYYKLGLTFEPKDITICPLCISTIRKIVCN